MSKHHKKHIPVMDQINDTSRFETEEPETIIIKAIGVGGGGNNAVDHMFREGIQHVSFVNINTDRQTLRHSAVPNRLVIGNGMGAGNIPEKARQDAEDSAQEIAKLFEDDTRMVFITAGMGGGTGTGAAPVVARIAKEHDLLTIGIVTIPFLFEGPKKIAKALAGADEMAKYVDALLVINNERLTEIYPDVNLVNGFAKADDTLTTAARSISELITSTGHINVDFNDVNTTLRDGGAAIISTGYGEGEKRVTKAIQDALKSPLLKNRNIMGSKKLLFNLYFNPKAEEEFLMEEVNELTEFVQSIDPGVDVIWGLAFDEELGNSVKITILAAGFEVSLAEEEDRLRNRVSAGNPALPRIRKPEPKPEPEVNYARMEQEYGKKVNELQPAKERQRYIILSADQLDDDLAIDLLEKTPTATRDKAVVEQLKNSVGSSQRPVADSDGSHTAGGGRIDFSTPL